VVDGAAALIVVHNHPSGDPSPSQADIAMTRQLAEAAAGHDQVVVQHQAEGGGHTSFRSSGLL
jgi:DNA repair protein RadC